MRARPRTVFRSGPIRKKLLLLILDNDKLTQQEKKNSKLILS